MKKVVIGNATLYLGDVIHCRNENQSSESAVAYHKPTAQAQEARGYRSNYSATERLRADH